MSLLYSCKTLSPKNSPSNPSNSYSEGSKGKDYSKISDKDRLDFEFNFFNANKEKILGNFETAESYFLKALQLNPSSAATMYELANIYSYFKNKKNALYYSRRAASLDPENIWYRLLYIDCLNESKQYPALIVEYKKLIKEFPESIEYLYELANVYLSTNNADEAIKMYDEIEKRNGISDEISMQKIRIYQATNNYEGSLEEVQKLIKEFPEEGKYYGLLGELYQRKGLNEEAYEAYKMVLKLNPDDPYAHLTMADYYRNQHLKKEAFAEIKIAFESPDLDIDTKVKILLSYYSITEEFEELKFDAYELCKLIVEVHPKEAKAFAIYGDFLYRDKKLEEAKYQYKKAIELDKEKYAIWNQLLIIESELNDYLNLETDSREAIELFPSQALPYFLNGAANIHLKKFEDAIISLNIGKDLVFNNDLFLSQFYASLGDAYNQLKKFPASDAAYDKALEIDPQNSYVLNNYAYYLSLRSEKLEKAEAMSKKSNEIVPDNSSFLDTYGWILYKMEKYEEAKVWILKAIESNGSGNGTLLEHYGDILFQLNDIDNAVIYWEDAKKAGGTSDFIDKKIADKKLYE